MTIALGVSIALIGSLQMRNLGEQLGDVANNRMGKVHSFSTLEDNLNMIGLSILGCWLMSGVPRR